MKHHSPSLQQKAIEAKSPQVSTGERLHKTERENSKEATTHWQAGFREQICQEINMAPR